MLKRWTELERTEITAIRRRFVFLFLPFVMATIIFSTFSVMPYVQITAVVFLFLFGIVEYINGYKGAALSDGLLGLFFIYLFILFHVNNSHFFTLNNRNDQKRNEKRPEEK